MKYRKGLGDKKEKKKGGGATLPSPRDSAWLSVHVAVKENKPALRFPRCSSRSYCPVYDDEHHLQRMCVDLFVRSS